MSRRTFVGQLQARALKDTEKQLRAAIARLGEHITDRQIDAYSNDSEETALYREIAGLERHQRKLRSAIGFAYRFGDLHLDEDVEEALQAAAAPRRPPRHRDAQHSPHSHGASPPERKGSSRGHAPARPALPAASRDLPAAPQALELPGGRQLLLLTGGKPS